MQQHSDPRRRSRSSGGTLPKVGMETTLASNAMKQITENYYKRRRILTVPQEILDAHPDKHFVYLNMPALEKNGFWDENGYEVFRVQDMPAGKDGGLQHKFQRSPDGLLHRNEMVLAHMPKAEYEARQLEKEVIRGDRDIHDVITRRPELSEFNPTAKITSETKIFPTKEGLNG